MKNTLLTCFCSLGLIAGAFAQDPTASPSAPATVGSPTAAPTAPVSTPAATPVANVSARARDNDDLSDEIERKVKKGLQITIGDNGRKIRHTGDGDFDEAALMAIPIVGIIFSTLFGAPVLIVGLILFFSYWKQRSLHRTVRLMVEKGQPVPEGLFARPGSTTKTYADMRRGIILGLLGVGLMIFFGAVSNWESDGPWVIGIIPVLMGAGYILLSKLEKPNSDKRLPES
jgi:hypothetical protein